MNRTFAVAVAIVFAVALSGCGGRTAGPTGEALTPTGTSATAPGEVALEPAYPEEVSTEGLTEEDRAQQQPHRHGDGEVHTHGAGTEDDHGHRH
jgi:hypothetical protein